ncbi:MAG: hypothetical protein ACK55I_34175, partial [bacterium]
WLRTVDTRQQEYPCKFMVEVNTGRNNKKNLCIKIVYKIKYRKLYSVRAIGTYTHNFSYSVAHKNERKIMNIFRYTVE